MKLKLCDIIIHCTSLTRLHILYSIRLCGNHWILLELSGLEFAVSVLTYYYNYYKGTLL